MKAHVFFLVAVSVVPLGAETPAPIALTGHVTSAEEGPMEGVLVGAKKTGSTVTVTVVSDEKGRFQFPAFLRGEFSILYFDLFDHARNLHAL